MNHKGTEGEASAGAAEGSGAGTPETRGGETRTRTFTLRRHGSDEIDLPECADAQRTEVNEGEGNEQTRIILCTRGDAAPAERAERLQRARDRLAGDTELSEEQRTRITAALDREIARIRGQ